jgi:hypothetical protein
MRNAGDPEINWVEGQIVDSNGMQGKDLGFYSFSPASGTQTTSPEARR